MSVWTEKDNALVATFKFIDHAVLFQAICDIHSLAEQHNHHPEVRYTYNTLDLKLTTHDAGDTVTEKDHKLAKAIEAVLND